MNTPNIPQPQAGGRYVRNGDGSLTQVEHTEPVLGRTEASRQALAERMGLAQPQPTDNTEE